MPAEHKDTAATARARLTGPGVYPVAYAHWLVHPLRRVICPAQMIVGRLGLRPTDQVLEIGAGPGYFSPRVAKELPQGHLTLYDLQAEMLALAAARLRKHGCRNYDIIEGNAARLPFADARFDVAFMVTVLGEVDDRQAAVAEAVRVLKPGGRLSVTEMWGDPDFVTVAELASRASDAGPQFEQQFGPRWYYTCNFLKGIVP